jgi:hypothetical protein
MKPECINQKTKRCNPSTKVHMVHLHHDTIENRIPIDQLLVPSKPYIQSTKRKLPLSNKTTFSFKYFIKHRSGGKNIK